MGMTIDEVRTALGKERKYALHENKQAFDIAIDVMCKYQMVQADYENRLKADMVAMLEDLKEQLREKHENFFKTELFDEAYGISYSMDLIEEKINSLKGNMRNVDNK